MPTGTTARGFIRNDTEFDGSGNLTPIEAGDAVNISFFAKQIGATGGVATNTINVYLSEDGNAEWTCIVGKRAEGSTANETFSPFTDWTRMSYTAEAPAENGDNDYTGGSAVATWTTASIQLTGSHFVPDSPPESGQFVYSTAYDDFKITANKPQVLASNEGILIYHSGDNYIQMGAGGLEIRGGNIQANAMEAPTVTSVEFQVKNKIINYNSGSDITIGTQDTTEEAAGNLNLIAGHSFHGSTTTGAGGGNIILTPGSGSGTDGHLGNGQGCILIGPTFTPRIIMSGSVEPTLGENDVEIQFKDPTGDKGVAFYTKQNGMAGGDGVFKLTCPSANGRLILGAGSWATNLLIDENGRIQVGTSLNASLTANTTYEFKVTGDIGYSGTITDTSDRRWKTNIENIDTGSLDIINNLQPINYNRIVERVITGSTGNERVDQGSPTYSTMSEDNTLLSSSVDELGFIAQDVESYIPEVIRIDDSDGKYSMDYSKLTVHLVGAIKELKAEVDALKNVSHSHG